MNYEELDNRIVAAIKERVATFSAICNRVGSDYSKCGRDVDRRLQSLRKRGVITYDSKAGWSLR